MLNKFNYLLNELHYNLDFLKIRKIPLRQLSYILPGNNDITMTQNIVVDEENDNILKQVRDIVLADRDLHDKVTFF